MRLTTVLLISSVFVGPATIPVLVVRTLIVVALYQALKEKNRAASGSMTDSHGSHTGDTQP